MPLQTLKAFTSCLLLCFIVSLCVIYWTINEAYNAGDSNIGAFPREHLLCVLVPYRDRLAELNQMIPYVHEFLTNQSVQHMFIVLNQTDRYRFNRASLINVGWFEADRLACDYICMHDVDILPLNPTLNYSYPGKGIVKHVSAGKYHPIKRYDYQKFIGGVLILTMEDFRQVDGMSNKYWGWGLEDDEFYLRLKEANMTDTIVRPHNLTSDRTNTFMHIHDGKKRKRDYERSAQQKKMSRRRDRISGLHSVKYTLRGRSFLHFDSVNASVLHVDLYCDLEWTPFCLSSKAQQ